jgi:protein-S-isoprenylcysteine O-methyltransferase Ste14
MSSSRGSTPMPPPQVESAERGKTRRKGERVARIAVNVGGALLAALFARKYLLYYLHSDRLIGVAFFAQQMWIMIAFLARRAPRAASRRAGDWALAFAGTFGGVLLQPSGLHTRWGFDAGFVLQLAGLAISVASLLALGRSFGSVAADRGIVARGPYAVVRHPLYAGYLLILVGYLLQSISVWNAVVILLVIGCDVGRSLVEERLLATSGEYEDYRRHVRWRLVPGLW